MKKILTIVIAVIISAYLLFNNTAKAEVIIEEGRYYDNAIPLTYTKKSFNVLKGISDEATFYETDFYMAYMDYLYRKIEFGDFEYTCELYNDNTTIPIVVYFLIEDGELSEYHVSIKGEIFYQIEFINYSFNVIVNESFDLYSITNTFETFNYRNLTEFDQPYVTYYPDKGGIYFEDCYLDMSLSTIYGYKYEYNQAYSDEDVYFLTTNSNPISMTDIEKSITISDSTDPTAEFEIVDNEYDLENIDITNGGEYAFTINAYDQSGNITIQKCSVYVLDNTPPVITGSNLVKDWNLFISEKALLALFICDDPDAKITLENLDNLLYNSTNYPGEYKIKATATDLSGNQSSCTIIVTIKDEEKPTVSLITDTPELLSTKKYTKEEILAFLSIKDRCYGDDVKVEITNYDDYLGYYWIPCRMVFNIVVTDPSGNSTKYELETYIKDYDFPQIDVGTAYTLILPAGSVITKEEVIEKLLQSGQISNVISVESEYFNSDNPYGTYDLYVTEENGNVSIYKIEIENPNINYDTPQKQEEENDNKYIKYVAIAIIAILGIGVIMLIMYKKKKH